MKVLIDIPQATFEYYQKLVMNDDVMNNVEKIIVNGYPMPNGVIPLDKVKQAREEIENIAWKSCSSKVVDGNRVRTELIDREDVLAILDSLIIEGEEK
jgi:hypothetical protein